MPAIAISGFGSATDIRNSRGASFYAHLTQPFDFASLHSTILQAVHGANSQNHASVASLALN